MGRLLFFIVFIAIVLGLIFLLRSFLQPSGSVKCSRCDGRGFWLGARGREKCDWCKGTGRLPRKI